MTNESPSIQLARFHIALYELQGLIYSQLLPLGSALECPDEEMMQALDLAAQSITAYLNKYQLQAVPNKEREQLVDRFRQVIEHVQEKTEAL